MIYRRLRSDSNLGWRSRQQSEESCCLLDKRKDTTKTRPPSEKKKQKHDLPRKSQQNLDLETPGKLGFTAKGLGKNCFSFATSLLSPSAPSTPHAVGGLVASFGMHPPTLTPSKWAGRQSPLVKRDFLIAGGLYSVTTLRENEQERVTVYTKHRLILLYKHKGRRT